MVFLGQFIGYYIVFIISSIIINFIPLFIVHLIIKMVSFSYKKVLLNISNTVAIILCFLQFISFMIFDHGYFSEVSSMRTSGDDAGVSTLINYGVYSYFIIDIIVFIFYIVKSR